MTNLEEFALMAKKNEETAWDELQKIMEKYSCSLHFSENKVDSQTVSGGLFFKFRADMFMSKGSKNAS